MLLAFKTCPSVDLMDSEKTIIIIIIEHHVHKESFGVYSYNMNNHPSETKAFAKLAT